MLFVFVEGPDDESYFTKVFASSWEFYKIIKYAGMKNDKINDFIKSIGCMPNGDYLFFGDSDGMEIEKKRESLLLKFPNLSSDKLFIVQFEIESWYYAGVDESMCRKLKMKNFIFQTDGLTKEQFYSKLARPSDKKYVMACILNQYMLSLAIERNYTLNLFVIHEEERTCNAVC